MSKYITEFIGTLLLCILIGLNSNAGSLNLIAIGTGLIGVIYAGGHISGAHYNPAVSLAVLLLKKMSLKEFAYYILAQCLAALVSVLICRFLFEVPIKSFVIDSYPAALTAEIIGTFALVFVILNVGFNETTKGNQYFGVAIGFTVIGFAYVFGPYSGAAFNPAVAISQIGVGFYKLSYLGLFIVTGILGSLLALVTFNNVKAKQ